MTMPVEATDDIELRLYRHQPASCSCGKENYGVDFHDQYCLYRVLLEAENEIHRLRKANEAPARDR